MARLRLDSMVLIDAFRGRPAAARLAALRRARTEPRARVTSVEALSPGLRPADDTAARRLFNGLRVAQRRAPRGCEPCHRAFARRGMTLHQADRLIASASLGVSAAPVTATVVDFPMAEIHVQHWPSTQMKPTTPKTKR